MFDKKNYVDQLAIDGQLTTPMLDSLIDKYGESDYLCGIKTFYLCAEDISEAEKYFQSIRIPHSTYLKFAHGYIFHSKFELDSAKIMYESSINDDIEKSNFWVHVSLAYLKEYTGSTYEDVEHSIRKAMMISKNNYVISSWAELNILFDVYDKADSILNILPTNYRPSWTNYLKSQIFIKKNNPMLAKEYLIKSIAVSKDYKESFEARLSLIDLFMTTNDLKKAELLINDMLAVFPESRDLLYRKAELFDKQRKYEDAIEIFEDIFEYEVLPGYFNEYIQISLDYMSANQALEKFNKYKGRVNKYDYEKFGFYIDAAELLILKKKRDYITLDSLNKRYDGKYFEPEIEYKNKLLGGGPLPPQ